MPSINFRFEGAKRTSVVLLGISVPDPKRTSTQHCGASNLVIFIAPNSGRDMGYLRPCRLISRLAQPRLSLLLGDLISSEWGDTNEGSVPMLGSFSRRIGVVRSYARKREIIREDDPATRVYQVISGTVCTTKMLRDGRRQVGGFYFSGDVFGLETTAKHTLAAQAITDVRVRIIKKQTLSALALSDCKVADRLVSLTARELARKQNLALLLSRSAQERVWTLEGQSYRLTNDSPGYCRLFGIKDRDGFSHFT